MDAGRVDACVSQDDVEAKSCLSLRIWEKEKL